MAVLLTSTALAALLALYMISESDDTLDARGSPRLVPVPDDDEVIASVARKLLRSPWVGWKAILDGVSTNVDRVRVLHAAARITDDPKTRDLLYRLIDDYRHGPNHH